VGRAEKIQGENEAILLQIAESDPTATLEEIRLEFARRSGLTVYTQTLVSTLRRKGIERDGARPVVQAAINKYPSIQTLFADSGYASQCAQTVSQCHGIRVQVVRLITAGGQHRVGGPAFRLVYAGGATLPRRGTTLLRRPLSAFWLALWFVVTPP